MPTNHANISLVTVSSIRSQVVYGFVHLPSSESRTAL